MEKSNIEKMTRGWFVGNFNPTAYATDLCEVGFKKAIAGTKEKKHIHKISTEISVVTNGKIRVNGKEYSKGDILVKKPGESADFEALTDTEVVVVKVPGAKNDKYLID